MPAPALSARVGGGVNILLKCENHQPTGSFKVRGAFNKLVGLSAEQRARGVVAASTGNHGMAVALAARRLGISATVFVPETCKDTKADGIAALGAAVVRHGTNCLDAELRARHTATETGQVFVSPYNDIDVVCGQGTIGLEIAQQHAASTQAQGSLAAVYVSVGGGGLIGGIGAAIKSVIPGTRVLGCQPANSCVMRESLQAGCVVDSPESDTLSDATAGGIEAESVTFGLCQAVVDEVVTVSEAEIADAMRLLFETEHILVEGAAAVALAALRRNVEQHRGRTVVVVLCGRNLSRETAAAVLGC
eukprot:TRINITY_DN5782_c0_g1_i1.p1 TRINITY_DN5782_c0_g1~~TRINITY_DN5782_c0_g1_i1.p1  ORF type:complete len:305 (+),score=68.27 TRINITY_DN5782_c0_g1_i1:175-1089(+)